MTVSVLIVAVARPYRTDPLFSKRDHQDPLAEARHQADIRERSFSRCGK